MRRNYTCRDAVAPASAVIAESVHDLVTTIDEPASSCDLVYGSRRQEEPATLQGEVGDRKGDAIGEDPNMPQGTAAKFQKPPVVEVWISVNFDPNEGKREWDMELVKQYVELYKTELPKLEIAHERQIQIEETSAEDLPKVIGHRVKMQFVRRSNEQRTRVLQIGDDQLSFHIMKDASDYPRYQSVQAEMQAKLVDYVQLFQPSQIRDVTLHYLDIIEIPHPESGIIDLSDYFHTSIDLPKNPFGYTAGFVHQFQVVCPVDDGPLLIKLQAIPAPPDSSVFRFQMEWHKQSSAVNTLDFSQVRSRMDLAHEYMLECFLASFTQRTLDLFEPDAENG